MNTAISDELKANISLFPNPASTTLNIEFEQAEPVVQLSVYDYSGKLFRQEDISNQMTTQVRYFRT